MKVHKYWSVVALITMIGTFYIGYKKLKSCHKYFAFSSMLCMVMVIYTGHKMILSILVYTLFSRMFDLMQPPAVKHSIAVV